MFALKKPKKRILFLIPIFTLGILLGTAAGGITDKRFEAYTDTLFTEALSSNTLSLHYTLADPEAYGISQTEHTLGRAAGGNPEAYFSSLENARTRLLSFPYQNLSEENQLTYDILNLYYETELSNSNQYLLGEILSPTLGIQAQLPPLLAEYTFRTKQDIQDYLHLLTDLPEYFDSIIQFEQQKSRQGYFMSDTTVDRILAQCQSFIASGDDNYLNSVFQEKIQTSSLLTRKEQKQYISLHKKAIRSCVIPAYETLMESLEALKGTGKNENGLYYLPGGRAYYTYLLKSSCGIYDSVDVLQSRLSTQLAKDSKEVQSILSKDPSLAASFLHGSSPGEATPLQILTSLQERIKKDFPDIPSVSYEVKYIHEDLKEHLSPAFYLTPPVDTQSPNLIYLNPQSNLKGIELYSTLAHEGFPGHLYQTQYFMGSEPSLIRHVLNMGGYTEGWATYTESYAYPYGSSDASLGRLFWLNRSVNLCLYALLDVGIHYYGWTVEETLEYLNNFGLTDADVCREIFQTIVEDPANYLKYYGGCLKFMDLREAAAAQENFRLIDFHEKVLETGPCQFPILEEYVLEK